MFNECFWSIIDLIVAISTVLAVVLAVVALLATKKQAKQIARERSLAHERDTLKALLDLALRDDSQNPGRYWKPGMAYLRTLSASRRAALPLTCRYFHHDWEIDLAQEALSRGDQRSPLEFQSLGFWVWTKAGEGPEGPGSPERSIIATIYDELIAAITEVVEEAS